MKLYSTFVIPAFIVLILSSCGKKYTCSHGIDYQPETVIFKGFTASQLEKVVVKKYVASSNFSNLISIDSLDASDANFVGDTAVAVIAGGEIYSGFFVVDIDIDYEITVLGTSQIYKITDVKGGPTTETWTQEERCSPGASMNLIVPTFLKVNGVDYTAFSTSPHRYLICLNH